MGKRRKSAKEYKLISGKRLHEANSVLAKSSAKGLFIERYDITEEDKKLWTYDKFIEGRFREVRTLIPKIIASEMYLDMELDLKTQIKDIRAKVDSKKKVTDTEIKFLRKLALSINN